MKDNNDGSLEAIEDRGTDSKLDEIGAREFVEFLEGWGRMGFG